MAEKTFQTYFFTAHNPGGHSSRPRPDNAIYELADALEGAAGAPLHADAERRRRRGYFEERARQEGNSPLGQQIRAWLANPNDGAAADAIEANPLEVGLTRTRCVATMLQAGHADNALPQTAQATVNCRIFPGVQPSDVQAELQQLAGPKIEVKPDPNYIGVPTPASPLRPDVLKAVTAAIQRFHGPEMHVFPVMSTGASDGSFFRAKGIPGLRRRRQLGNFARRRARPRPRRAATGAGDVRRRAPLGDDHQGAGGLSRGSRSLPAVQHLLRRGRAP